MATGRITHVKPASASDSQTPGLADPSELLEVMTGGSTGDAKPLVRPANTWRASAQIESTVFDLSSADRYAVLGSPAHSLWAYVAFRSQQAGSVFIGLQSIGAPEMARLQSEDITVLYGLPELVMVLARRLVRSHASLPRLRRVLMGGGPPPPGLSVEELRQAFPVATCWSFYGAAETSFIAYAALGEPYQAFPGVDIRMGDDQLIWVKSPMTITPEAWVNTGDLGQWLDTQKSFMVLGRAVRQLQIKGKKFPVEQMEQFLSECLKTQRLALVSDSHGHPCCLLVDDPVPSSGAPTAQRINDLIRGQQPGFPLIRRVEVLDQANWPLTSSGKTNWRALQGIASQTCT